MEKWKEDDMPDEPLNITSQFIGLQQIRIEWESKDGCGHVCEEYSADG